MITALQFSYRVNVSSCDGFLIYLSVENLCETHRNCQISMFLLLKLIAGLTCVIWLHFH